MKLSDSKLQEIAREVAPILIEKGLVGYSAKGGFDNDGDAVVYFEAVFKKEALSNFDFTANTIAASDMMRRLAELGDERYVLMQNRIKDDSESDEPEHKGPLA